MFAGNPAKHTVFFFLINFASNLKHCMNCSFRDVTVLKACFLVCGINDIIKRPLQGKCLESNKLTLSDAT